MSSIYVNLGPMSADKSKVPAKYQKTLRDLMRNTAERMISRTEGFTTTKPTTKDMGTAYHLDGSLTSLTIATKGQTTKVSCAVKLVLATYPNKQMFAFPSGTGSATGGSSQNQIQDSAKACVRAVTENLVKKCIKAMQDRAKRE